MYIAKSHTLMPINFLNLTFWSLFPKFSFSQISADCDLSYKDITYTVNTTNMEAFSKQFEIIGSDAMR